MVWQLITLRLAASHCPPFEIAAIADFFYVPVWAGCWLSRFSRPTPGHHALPIRREWELFKTPRAQRASDMIRQSLNFVRQRFPYFNRSGGADHIFAFPHDEVCSWHCAGSGD